MPDSKPFWAENPDLSCRVDEAMRERMDATPPAFSDDDLALRFTGKYGDVLRYVAGWGKWLRWDGRRWKADDTRWVFDRARLVCRAAAAEAGKRAKDIASAHCAAAVEKLASADRCHAATPEQFDADPWVLNTPGGVVDLRSGVIRPHNPCMYLTRITAAPAGGECPVWLNFLNRVTDGNTELQAFLQRIAGYALTGSTRDHALFFCYGTGGNGKGIFLNTLTRLLGDYATVAPIETFIVTAYDRHPTELAGLKGARLVTAQETEKGRRWSEVKINKLTGEDGIRARFMRQDFFTFQPQFTLVIAGNHKPSLNDVNEAIRRRFHLIPFTVLIPEKERDTVLSEKLKDEWPGILAWAIQGCLEWQRIGLHPPAVVLEETQKYLAEEDSFGTWLEECCELDPRGRETSANLFASWNAWAERNKENAWTKKHFSQVMEQRGFEAYRTRDVRGHSGLRLKSHGFSDAHCSR